MSLTDKSESADIFKICPTCRNVWKSRDLYLQDSKIRLLGYQPHFENHTVGFFLFDHQPCGTSMAIPLSVFRDVYPEPIFQSHVPESEAPSLCLHSRASRMCPSECECSSVQQLIQIIQHWPESE